MDYRKEIDGLRALAILPVVMFHSGLPMFNWGYIGVDIFFVISGYLITSIIYPKIKKNEFSFIEFYENRVRRLFPALFVMVAFSSVIALMIMDPKNLVEYSYSVFSSLFFYSNFFFWNEIDYFEDSSELMPLLHTWSLSIEEQFYILFPIILIFFLTHTKHKAFLLLNILCILSFLLWCYGTLFHSTANFYLPITRAWELLAGAILSIHIYEKGFPKGKFSDVGILILILSFYIFSLDIENKNLFMFFPVTGVILILLSKDHSFVVNLILKNKLFVFFGLISYSLYLYHQPIFAFAKVFFVDLDNAQTIFIVALSILISYISWRFVESIFRKRLNSKISFQNTLNLLTLPLLISITIGSYSIYTDGNKENYLKNLSTEDKNTYILLDKIKIENENDYFIDNLDCVISSNTLSKEMRERIEECYKKYGEGILIFGDSHAKDIFNSIYESKKHNFIIGLSENFCQLHEKINQCFYQELIEYLSSNEGFFKKIFFNQAGYFLLEIDGKQQNSKSLLSKIPLLDESNVFLVSDERVTKILNNLTYFPKQTIFIGPKKELHIDERYIRKLSCNGEFNFRSNLEKAFEDLDSKLQLESKLSRMNYLSLQDEIKLNPKIDFINCNEIYWTDGDHWSGSGEKHFSERVLKALSI